jgi:hypothetical protein
MGCGSGFEGACWEWWFVDDGPEAADLADGIEELSEIDRFDDVSVDAELVAADEVLFFAGAGEDDDRDMFESGVGFHVAEYFEAVHFGHFEVEQDDDGMAVGVAVEVSAGVEVIQGFGSIASDDDFVGEVFGFKGGEGELDILSGVFRQEDAFEWGHGSGGLSTG